MFKDCLLYNVLSPQYSSSGEMLQSTNQITSYSKCVNNYNIPVSISEV